MYQIFSITNLYNNSFIFTVDLKCHQKFHRKKKIYTHMIYIDFEEFYVTVYNFSLSSLIINLCRLYTIYITKILNFYYIKNLAQYIIQYIHLKSS